MTSTQTHEDFIEIKIDDLLVARFEDGGNGMEGEIFEGDNTRLEASDLINVARFILSKAAERALDKEL